MRLQARTYAPRMPVEPTNLVRLQPLRYAPTSLVDGEAAVRVVDRYKKKALRLFL